MLLHIHECNGTDPEWNVSKVMMVKLKIWVPGTKDGVYVAEFLML